MVQQLHTAANLGTLFKEHEQREDTDTPAPSTEQKVNDELEQFIHAPKLDFEEDPLSWWKTHSATYPLLSVAAKKYLSVCATSSASERLFSVSGNIVSSTRNSLKPDKVELLTFLATNL